MKSQVILFSFEVNKNLRLQITLNPRYAKNVIRNVRREKNYVYSLKAGETSMQWNTYE